MPKLAEAPATALRRGGWAAIALPILAAAALNPVGAARTAQAGEVRDRGTVLQRTGFEPRPGQPLPRAARWRDSRNNAVYLQDFLDRERPLILVFAYYSCPNLCSLVLDNLAASTRGLALRAGDDYEVVVVSIDARDGPRAARAAKAALTERAPGADAWHLLTGGEAAIDELAAAAGLRYVYDPRLDEFAHPAGIVLIAPDGRVARYLYGIDFLERDLRLGLIDTAAGSIGGVVDRVLLYCYGYDAGSGSYSLVIWNVVRAGGAGTAAALGGFIAVMVLRERRRRGRPPAAGRDR